MTITIDSLYAITFIAVMGAITFGSWMAGYLRDCKYPFWVQFVTFATFPTVTFIIVQVIGRIYL